YPSTSPQLGAVGVMVEAVLQVNLVGDLRLCHLHPALQPGQERIIKLVCPVVLRKPGVLYTQPPPLLQLSKVHVGLEKAPSPHHQADIQQLHDVDGMEVDVAVEEMTPLCNLGLSLCALGQVWAPDDLQNREAPRKQRQKKLWLVQKRS